MAIDIEPLYLKALELRIPRIAPKRDNGLRLFNGYTEGYPRVAVDLYGTTLVIHDATSAEGNTAMVDRLLELTKDRLPWLEAAICKLRESDVPSMRNGSQLLGTEADLCTRLEEDDVSYAIRLQLNRDASFYLDTAPLRTWAKANLAGKRVLNTFSYTGSLGAAAMAGGAARVVSTDLNRQFLTVAKDTWSMNGWPIKKMDFITGDFFDVVGKLKRGPELFDCVFVDPPFFSVTMQGRVDLEADMLRILNKARPLVADGGVLVAINNGVFVSGAAFDKTLAEVCADGFLTVEQRIDVPDDFAGHPGTRQGTLPTDPAPWNHSTKMAILRVKRKDSRV
jgi:23S rRNA (cytosine1962-C5)-methyltransferase